MYQIRSSPSFVSFRTRVGEVARRPNGDCAVGGGVGGGGQGLEGEREKREERREKRQRQRGSLGGKVIGFGTFEETNVLSTLAPLNEKVTCPVL